MVEATRVRPGGKVGFLRDVRRLVELGDIVYYLGNLLYRRSLRYTLFTAGIGILGYVTRMAGVAGFTARQAIALPLLVGGTSLFGGLTLKMIPTLLASRRLTQAQAGDLNLMEDYRKSRQETHLQQLWQRVYRHEPAPRGQMAEASEDPSPEARFLRLARYALKSPLPQMRQRYSVGLDLRYFEDWRDGAFFDTTDNKLMQQFDGDRVLDSVKRRAHWPLSQGLKRALRKVPQRFWFSLTMRAIALGVADALEKLNRHYDTDMFNSQVLLWPGEEDQHWQGPMREARGRILLHRKRIVHRAFGADRKKARQMIHRLFLPDLLAATQLRLRYDPQYLCGLADLDLRSDLEEAFAGPKLIAGLERTARRLRKKFAAARQWWKQNPCPQAQDSPEVQRAVDIALLTAPGRLLPGACSGGKEPNPAGRELKARIEEAIRTQDVHNHRLTCLRLHHELTRLQISEYLDLIDRLERSFDPGADERSSLTPEPPSATLTS
jgi:hypothetical protein